MAFALLVKLALELFALMAMSAPMDSALLAAEVFPVLAVLATQLLDNVLPVPPSAAIFS